VERRRQWQQDAESELARQMAADVPAGHRLMPEDERQQTLSGIQLSM